MKKILFPLLSVLLIAVVLFGASWALRSVAAENAQKEHLRLLQTLLPGSESFTLESYTGDDANIRSVHKGENGFVIETCTYGYAGEITMLIGVSNEGKVVGLRVLDMSETLGLGANALTDYEFLAQFLNTEGDVAIQTGGEDAFSGATGTAGGDAQTYVDGITGATVTSKAITRCVNSAVAYVTGADANSGATSWGG